MELIPVKPKARVVPTFRSLTPAVKDRIFALLDKKSRCLARGVCMEWAMWLKKYFGVHVGITNSNADYVMTKPKYGREVTQVTLKNWTWPIDHSQSYRVTRFLRTLEVSGYMSPTNLLDFLKHCDLLENLTFTLCQFEQILSSDLTVDESTFKPNSKLKSIRIQTDGGSWNFSMDDLFILNVVKYFDLTNLTSFVLCKQYSTIGEKCDYNIAGKKDFTFRLGGIVNLDETVQTLRMVTKMVRNSSATLKVLHLENIAEILYARGRPVTLPAALQELTGVIRYSYGWGALLAQQNCLTALRVEFNFEFWNRVKSCITACAATLKEVKIVGFYGINPEIRINLNFMRNFARLKKLDVECNEAFITVKKFPASLESLCLNAPFTREDFRYFVFSFTNLRRLCLKNYGYDTTEGDAYSHIPADIFDLDQFQFLIQAPKLQKLVFLHCMMFRMPIVNFCKETDGMFVKSQCATVDNQTIGYMYNMEVSMSPGKKKLM